MELVKAEGWADGSLVRNEGEDSARDEVHFDKERGEIVNGV